MREHHQQLRKSDSLAQREILQPNDEKHRLIRRLIFFNSESTSVPVSLCFFKV